MMDTGNFEHCVIFIIEKVAVMFFSEPLWMRRMALAIAGSLCNKF